jgi:hypothetical protein
MAVERGQPRNEVLAIAHAKLAVSTEGDTDLPHSENGLKIRQVTKCAISFCTREYDVTVSSGELLVHNSEPDWGRVFTHAEPQEWGLPIETTCWTPTSTAGQVPVIPVSSEMQTPAQYANDSAFTLCPDFNAYHQLPFLFAGSTFQSWDSLGDSLTLWNLTDRRKTLE